MASNDDMEMLIRLAGQIRLRPEWAAFAEFCECRGRGLRQDALRQLEVFLGQAASWRFESRLEFVTLVLEESGAFSDTRVPIPEPLRARLVLPTLNEWADSSERNALPHLWLGLLRSGNAAAHLERALELDPSCERARTTLVELIVADIKYNQHELPAFYIHDPRRDLEALDQAERLAGAANSAAWAESVARTVEDLRLRANAWIAEHPGETDFAVY